MHAPELARDTRLGVLSALRGAEREVEPHEVERGADPRDPGDHVEHAEEDVEDVLQVWIQRSLAIATSSRQPVSSSSSRVRAMRSAEDVEDLRLRPAIHEHDEAEAELPLVRHVQRGEVRRARHGSSSAALLRGRACARAPSSGRSPDGRRAPRPSPPRSGRARTPSARSSGCSISARRSTRRVRPSKRSASSSTVSFRGSSRIRTAKRGAGRGDGRPELDLELDAREERRRRPEDELVASRLEPGRELGDAAVGVRLARRRRPRDRGRARPGLPRPACRRRVEDVSGDRNAHVVNLRACTRWARAISASSALTSAPPRTTSSPSTTSRSTRCGAEKTRPATASSAPAELEDVRPPDREVGPLPRLERADVVAAEHRWLRRALRARAPPERSAQPGRRVRVPRAAPASPR